MGACLYIRQQARCIYKTFRKRIRQRVVKSGYRWQTGKGGRPCKLSKSQKKRLCEWIKAGPQAAGYPSYIDRRRVSRIDSDGEQRQR